ncbi:CsbD family protein [Nitrospira sp. Kam-Ns4a]
MTQEQFKASWGELKGALKTRWGNMTDEDLRQIEGDLDQFNGAIQKRYGELQKEEVRKWRIAGMPGGPDSMWDTKRSNPCPPRFGKRRHRKSRAVEAPAKRLLIGAPASAWRRA